MNTIFITKVTPLYDAETYNYYYNTLDQTRKQKVDKLKKTADKIQSVGIGILLKHAVETSTDFEYKNLKYATQKNGKPYFEGNPFYFSLSHSNDYAVCVISDTPVGIDIEFDKPLNKKMQTRFAENILEWTKKEAKGKLTGLGVLDKTEDTFVYTHKKTDGYIITVCSDKKIDDFVEYNIPSPK